MNDLQTLDEYPALDASTAVAEREPERTRILPICDIESMDGYLKNYGKILGKKAIHALEPLHVPNRDPLPDFIDMLREPFPAQQHVIAAAVKMLDTVRNGFIVGEMGTGKTLLGMLGVHFHAMRSRRQGGSGGKYRGLILCPDHLIGKWCREVEETIPGAIVTRFGPQGMLEDDEKPKRRKRGEKAPKTDPASKAAIRDTLALLDNAEGNRWAKPKGAEWYVMGRNQAKWMSNWAGMADVENEGEHCLSSKSVVVDKVSVVDDTGRPVYGSNGKSQTKNVYGRVHYCPTCGVILTDKKGVPLSAKDLKSGKEGTQKFCIGTHLQMVPSGPDKKSHGLVRIKIPRDLAAISKQIGKEVNYGGYKWVVRACKAPLFNYVSRPYRWSPARIIQGKLRRFFKYLVIDEVHEQKSATSAQSMAASKLIGSVDHVIALTGTIIGGYANHLYPLLMRISPKTLRAEGFEWGKEKEFNATYGKIDRVVTMKELDDAGPSVRGNVKSMRKAKSGTRNEEKYVRPGVMPTMFGRHMIGSSMFITLDEMSSELPDLFEYVGGQPGDAPQTEDFPTDAEFDEALERHDSMIDGHFDVACDMEPQQRDEYRRVMACLEHANKELLVKGSMKLLGTYLWTGLDYPDKPFGWGHDIEVLKAISKAGEAQAPGLLGQSFLNNFNHTFEPTPPTLVLTRTVDGKAETDRIPLKKDESGVFWIDVKFNGKFTKPLIYDTGASVISLSMSMASDIGIKQGEGSDCNMQIADGTVVAVKKTTIPSVTIGAFTLKGVECVVVPPCKMPHTLGYWDKPKNRKIENFIGVVTPRDCPEDRVYPKEQCLIDICLKQKKDGRQTWVYVNMTGKRDVRSRLAKLLEENGLKVGILDSDEVKPIDREDWIAKNGRDYDVMISHPQLVSTGLDLFSKKQGGHNYSTLVFYETGYNLFTMRQAARRAWRIGQPRDCRVYYLYYKETMQHKAMTLMSKKMAAAQALEGEFSEEGLAAMAGEDNLQMALAKNLSERIDDSDMQRSWGKVKSGPKKKKPGAALADVGAKLKPSPLDKLPIELQIVAETMLDSEGKPVPPEALADFPDIDAAIAGHVPLFDPLEINQEFSEHDHEADDEEDAEQPVAEAVYDEEIEYDSTFDDEYVADDDLVMTEDILAKMFANLVAHGLDIG